MYNIIVESPLFTGKSLVQQHKLVTSSIQEELKSIHGYNLKTKIPDEGKLKEEGKAAEAGEQK
jgi:stress-induced morphogen